MSRLASDPTARRAMPVMVPEGAPTKRSAPPRPSARPPKRRRVVPTLVAPAAEHVCVLQRRRETLLQKARRSQAAIDRKRDEMDALMGKLFSELMALYDEHSEAEAAAEQITERIAALESAERRAPDSEIPDDAPLDQFFRAT